ncbi:hypothetical protein LOK49_LG05G01849 [Camellia lanceoleosa]|uniref:Uncharacterized protein n=1 Tax=Camellia lanceoleosa TaxID=1840588 RepID=A0ACC0HI68_9ERIC|nr:hypothetical protein LOK49_LG05G01849 [Camellia lanceoleosa]
MTEQGADVCDGGGTKGGVGTQWSQTFSYSNFCLRRSRRHPPSSYHSQNNGIVVPINSQILFSVLFAASHNSRSVTPMNLSTVDLAAIHRRVSQKVVFSFDLIIPTVSVGKDHLFEALECTYNKLLNRSLS